MSVLSLGRLTAEYGRKWTVYDGIGGGYFAVRNGEVSEVAQSRGMETVVCGGTLAELARRLESQKNIEARLLGFS
ncbi:hypothetical protein [Streptosporangium sp. NPDC087985]|uniref:hypothetical protein n=1 Tax=Streptosporangium sp. NPDC087985 TaxID=3366196 RepID=UPI003822F39E